MRASDVLIEKIKQMEGYRAKAYRCPASVWTCWYWSSTYNANSIYFWARDDNGGLKQPYTDYYYARPFCSYE